jgi:hypothetical protein
MRISKPEWWINLVCRLRGHDWQPDELAGQLDSLDLAWCSRCYRFREHTPEKRLIEAPKSAP